MLFRQAVRIAVNRTVGGMHFPVDSAAGQVLGLTLADYFVALCTGSGFDDWEFDGTAYPASQDWDGRDQYDTNTGARTATAYAKKGASRTAAKSPPLEWLWKKALAEWA